jgi:GntR family transcriptional repressor for pyruvate dehydrogenase complex
MQLKQPKLADMVAARLRDRILSGDLKDGDELPSQEVLLGEFGVSKPSMREALRILEAEGLTTVRRGNRGGAIVHTPKAENAAVMIGLTLQCRGVPLSDIGHALRAIEPVCAGLCAAKEDRATTVVPALRAIHQEAVDASDDPLAFTSATRRFHQEIVAQCGNETLILVVGALEVLWSASETTWAYDAASDDRFPDKSHRSHGLRVHEKLIDVIADGAVKRASEYAAAHLNDSLEHM